MSKDWKTAAYVMAELEADADFRARARGLEEERALLIERQRAAEAPLLEKLRNAGVPLDALGELHEHREYYPLAVPVLLEHLEGPYPDSVRMVIARLLAVPEARRVWSTLSEIFQRTDDRDAATKEGLAAALEANVEPGDLDKVIELVRDPGHGPLRSVFVRYLARSRDPRAQEVLEELRCDPDLAREIAAVLKRRRRARSGRMSNVSHPAGPHLAKLVETSMNLDLDMLEPLLQRLSGRLDSGLEPGAIAQLLDAVEEVEPDEERDFDFDVMWEGRQELLKIAVVLDDYDSPALTLHAPESLVTEIRVLYVELADQRGV